MKRLIQRVVFLLLISVIANGLMLAQNVGGGLDVPDPDRPPGLRVNEAGATTDGYMLIPLVQDTRTLLLAPDGRIVHTWDSPRYTANSVYLKENGNLIRTVGLEDVPFSNPGKFSFVGGRIEEVTPDGEVVWSFEYMDENNVPHHDIEILPNGNILMIIFERYERDAVLAAGRDPEKLTASGDVWSEKIIEFDPSTNEIVWEWRVWDHLVQDYDPELPNYGAIKDNPQRININYMDTATAQTEDWLHMNAIDYHPEFDQIILSPREMSEIWIIDHGITTDEAKGEAGDLLYRWGNPEAHGTGDIHDQWLYVQHDVQWIEAGLPGAGNVLVFDNGSVERPYSRVIEIALPVDENGNYERIVDADTPQGQPEIVWQYTERPPYAFYSRIISGAQRQANGNTLITSGSQGRIFEVTPDMDIVWEYNLPVAVWAFRAERYDASYFENYDLSGDIVFESGIIWGRDCADGTRPRLYSNLPVDYNVLNGFIGDHGEAMAQTVWEEQACAEHGGFAED